MEVIVAVLEDLYTFAVKYRFGLVSDEREADTKVRAFTESLARSSQQVFENTTDHRTLDNTEEVLSAEQVGARVDAVGYVCVPDAPLYALPTRMFDGVIDRLSFGDSFQVRNTQGKWLEVECKELRGWIQRDNTTESKRTLEPQFIANAVYNDEHPATVKLRTRIDDAFFATPLALPLQDVEYVTYKLFQKGRIILWPHERPRVAGTWQRLLKGVRGIHMGIAPKTGAVMEYINEDNTGHVAYVESVYPDSSMTITEIGYPTEGVYSERTLSKDEWKELRPVFIEVA
jgi:hypothetical protein